MLLCHKFPSELKAGGWVPRVPEVTEGFYRARRPTGTKGMTTPSSSELLSPSGVRTALPSTLGYRPLL